jgi:membrane protease YdiL (CAAX protease family)
MSFIDALKRLGFALGGMILLSAVVIGTQQVIHHRIPSWVGAILLLLLVFGVYVLYVRLTERRRVDELAPGALLPQTLLGLLVGVALFAGVIGLLAITGHYHYLGFAVIPSILAAFLTTVTPAVLEELLFRGFLFRAVQSIGGTWIGIVVSAVIFGALHGINPHATIVSSLAIAIEAGVLLASAYAATSRLWLPIGIHIGWNFTEGHVFGVPVSGGPTLPSFFQGTISGPDLLSGGSFGLEASVPAILVSLVASAVLITYTVRAGRIVPVNQSAGAYQAA